MELWKGRRCGCRGGGGGAGPLIFGGPRLKVGEARIGGASPTWACCCDDRFPIRKVACNRARYSALSMARSQKARDEVHGHRYSDLSYSRGLSLLSQCR